MNEIETAIIDHEKKVEISITEIKHEAAKLNSHLTFDPDQLAARYEAEKKKRINEKGSRQYHLADKASGLLDNPINNPTYTREPITAVYDVVVLGAGYTALQAAARLVENGYDNIALFERGGDFGGTWYWNRYPGAQCDIESYIYMPLIEELSTIPTEKYARGPELFRHAQAIGEKYRLRERTHFWTTINEFRWDDSESMWHVITDRHDKIRSRWFIAAPGPLQDPKFPGVPGFDTFQGKSFHTARWDYAYTGGNPENRKLTGLANKRVGVVGTGATAIQVVPQVGDWAKELYVFQRTPSSVDVRSNRPTDDGWASSLVTGWQRKRQENFSTIISGAKADEDLVNDGWTYILQALGGFTGNVGGLDPATIAARLQLADYQQMERVRKRVDDIIRDPATAEGLKPYYNQWCKRPCFHDEYLDTFNRPSVHLVHTDGKGIERITSRGIVANGQEIELDCIIYATGFEWNNMDFTKSRSSLQITGRNGLRLVDKWHAGAITFQGWNSHNFPNSMIISPLQAGGNPNYTHNAGELARHLLYLMKKCKELGITVMEASEEAEKEWVKVCLETQGARGKFLQDCIPGYYNDEGHVSEVTLRNQPYGGGPREYLAILERWRNADKLEGLVMKYHSAVKA